MHESFVIELSSNGQPLNLTWVNRGWTAGAVLNDEWTTFPRPFYLHFRCADAGTKQRLRWVRSEEGWPGESFRLQRFFRDGSIGFRGVRKDTLPAGNYVIEVLLRGFPESGEQSLTIEKGRETQIQVELKGDDRIVRLDRPLDAFDPQILGVIDDPNSKLDTKPLREWLADDSRTPARRACLLNLLAKLRSVPNRDHPLIRHVENVFVADIDRIYASVKPAFQAQLEALVKSDAVSSTHRKLLKWNRLDPKLHRLRSYREPVTGTSMQCVLAVPKSGAAARFVDLDIDEANPQIDLVRFFKHVGEVLDGHPTDHLDLRDKLAREDAGEFLSYKVERPV